MGAFTLPWGLTGALLIATYLHSLCVSASPSINVGLKASFPSAPYLLELLETAADENATSYFPLLDRIAEGYFSKATTDKDLYDAFLKILEDDGHLRGAEALSSYQFALSMRSSAPRIEAHYQYYYTAVEPSLKEEQAISCSVWAFFNGKQYCSPSLEQEHGEVDGDKQLQELQFDRLLGATSLPASVLYADITSSTFGPFHKTLVKTARDGKISYRVRHRRSLPAESKPLSVPGYGVELALKRTDYIVIDDREEDEGKPAMTTPEKEVKFEDEGFADLKPLSTSELTQLGVKAASFVMQSERPLDTLVKLTQDFPKYSSAIASHNATQDFVNEHEWNRAQLVPAGYNVIWMNGLQLNERDIEALDLLDVLRKERKLIKGVSDLGFSSSEAMKLLSHENITSAKAETEQSRYDYRDDMEGGNVIIWMNNIEKDKRYADWPSQLAALLQRTYPGQLPQVRRDIFNIVLPIDFTSTEDVFKVVETLLSFVKRKLPLRIGLVPLSKSIHSLEQARTVYHLIDTYGLAAATTYLEKSFTANKLAAPSESIFEEVAAGHKVKTDKISRPVAEVLKSDDYQDQIEASQKWLRRLSVEGTVPVMFVDGVALPADENWLQSMSARVTSDLQTLQQAIFTETLEVEADDWLPMFFLASAATRRNSLIVPEDPKTLKVFDISKLIGEHRGARSAFPLVEADASATKAEWAHLILVADLESQAGAQLLKTATALRATNTSIELLILHNPSGDAPDVTHSGLSAHLFQHKRTQSKNPFTVESLLSVINSVEPALSKKNQVKSNGYWHTADFLIKSIGLRAGENALLVNGRLVGPIPKDADFQKDDFEQLITYERVKRITPVFSALEELGLSDKVADPLSAAKISSIVAVSTTSDKPDGIFEQGSPLRLGGFNIWNSSYTAIEVGEKSTASVQFTVLLDPASETGQRWVPILKVLSELDGVYMQLFLNPKDRLQELPVKRFYRYVLESKPKFDDAGALRSQVASFRGVPQEALLTVALDIPPAWLVAPKETVHDLDNIKLSSIKGDVEAIYELENILIEGHSREVLSGGQAPRGAQLILGTDRDPHHADTIIMANLGYFQFKANPGFYKIDLKEGRSSEIFNIDSVGAKGWSPLAGDESSEVVLMSFKGTTLYPRLSRKAGMETEDVLEAKVDSKVDNFVSRGLNFAQAILGKSKGTVEKQEQAEINIFSVASGHLYERMLNIMMVSVMKHTKHTVKFWFIEQFLSPSFKDFIPSLAAEYGFQYEMVTYKWPHWLRAQTEKQREIWGYKILFLDVLFPLSLEKVIFVDADQIVRTDMIELVNHDLEGAPYGFTPMCDSRTEMEGFRFWKQGYWEKFLRGLPYHISALYVVDLHRFRQIAAGDRLRQQYQSLSADPGSLSNLDQDLPNHMQSMLPIHSLPQEWLWCETWCSDEALKEAKTIDLCNNPLTKEPKLDRARRQVPEWTVYDDEIAAVDKRRKGERNSNSRTLEAETTSIVGKKDEL